MRTWGSLSLCLAFVMSAALGGACAEESGLSVGVACTTYCDAFVECTVTNPVDADNVHAACMTTCEDTIAVVEDANPDNRDCSQALRETWRCYGGADDCTDIEMPGMNDQICRGEVLDIVEFCTPGTY